MEKDIAIKKKRERMKKELTLKERENVFPGIVWVNMKPSYLLTRKSQLECT